MESTSLEPHGDEIIEKMKFPQGEGIIFIKGKGHAKASYSGSNNSRGFVEGLISIFDGLTKLQAFAERVHR